MIVGIVLLLLTFVILAKYIRELILYFTRRDKFNHLVKSEMRAAEFGGKKVGLRDRLFLSYPLLIILGLALSVSIIWNNWGGEDG